MPLRGPDPVVVFNSEGRQTLKRFDLQCKIHLDGDTNNSQSVISGHIVLSVHNKPITFYGICLLLFVKTTSILPTKTDAQPRLSRNVKKDIRWDTIGSAIFEPQGSKFFDGPDSSDWTFNFVDTHQDNNILRVYTVNNSEAQLGNDTNNALKIQLEVGTHNFPFTVNFNDVDGIPSSFQRNCGSVQHFLGLYMNPDTTLLYFSKFHLQKIQLPQYRNSFFSEYEKLKVSIKSEGRGNSLIEGDFKLNESKFVLGDSIEFSIRIKNQNRGRISEISIALVQIIAGYVTKLSKSELTVVSSLKHMVAVGAINMIEWNGELSIAPDLLVSCGKTELNTVPSSQSVIIFYVVRFAVNVVGKGGLSCEIPITVGSTRNNVQGGVTKNSPHIRILEHQYLGPNFTGEVISFVPPMRDINLLDSAAGPPTTAHGSGVSSFSFFDTSGERRCSLPPAYSQISLFRSPSLETCMKIICV